MSLRVAAFSSPGPARALLGFAAFGMFWGAWGAVLPAVQAETEVDDSGLGLALLCVGVGALLAMRLAGLAIDRWGDLVLPAAERGSAVSIVTTIGYLGFLVGLAALVQPRGQTP